MGGEHIVQFHNDQRWPCRWIHDDDVDHRNRPITNNVKRAIIWHRICKEIVRFCKECSYFKGSLIDTETHYIYFTDANNTRLELTRDPIDFCLSWNAKIGNIGGYRALHDIAEVLFIAFPGELCAYFDRCESHNYTYDGVKLCHWIIPEIDAMRNELNYYENRKLDFVMNYGEWYDHIHVFFYYFHYLKCTENRHHIFGENIKVHDFSLDLLAKTGLYDESLVFLRALAYNNVPINTINHIGSNIYAIISEDDYYWLIDKATLSVISNQSISAHT